LGYAIILRLPGAPGQQSSADQIDDANLFFPFMHLP
jgi:hypothetical protein